MLVTVGAVPSTVIVLLAALGELLLPDASCAAPARMLMPTVPLPVQLERVTVADDVVPLVTLSEQLAPPVVFNEASLLIRLYAVAPLYVMV